MSAPSSRFLAFVKRVLRRRAEERTLDEEIGSYLEHDIDARMASGMSRPEARRAALVDLGGRDQVMERVRSARAGAWVDALVQDLRYGVRTLVRDAGFSLTVIGSLSVGIAAAVAGFTLVNAVFFKPLPGVRDDREVVRPRRSELCTRAPRCWFPNSYEDYLAIRDSSPSLDLASFNTARVTATLSRAEVVNVAFVSENYFRVLGVEPRLGRAFDDASLGDWTAVISHGLWIREFGADSAVVGRSMTLANHDAQIVGVAPRSFAGTNSWLRQAPIEVWLPMSAAGVAIGRNEAAQSGRVTPYSVVMIGRLRHPVGVEQARAQVETAIRRLADARHEVTVPAMVDLADARGNTPARIALGISIVVPIPVLVLVLACVNAASVLVARASRRVREIALRLAIGASRARIVRQLLTESFLLALASSAAALPLVWFGLSLTSRLMGLPLDVDGSVAVQSLLTAVVSALCFGLAPAIRLSRQPARSLVSGQGSGEATPRLSRARSVMVVIQVGLSLGLLATGTQVVAVLESEFRRAGSDPDRLVLATFDVEQLEWIPAEADRFYERLLDGARQMPQATSAGLGPFLWTRGRGTTPDISLVAWRATDGPNDGEVYFGGHVTRHLFDAVGLRIVEGRGFLPEDEAPGAPRVAVVNRPFAGVMDGQPLGQVLRVGRRRTSYETATEVRVVGVVEPATEPGFSRGPDGMPAVYLPRPLASETTRVLYVRSRGTNTETMAAMRALVERTDRRVPILELSTLQQVNERLYPQVWLARLAAGLGLIALGLSTVGLYGVIGYVVGLRSKEFAVRLALGASPAAVVRLVVRDAFGLTAIGVVLGLAVGAAIAPFVQEERMPTFDVTALTGPLLLSLASILLASAVPAIRAARVDPIAALKAD